MLNFPLTRIRRGPYLYHIVLFLGHILLVVLYFLHFVHFPRRKLRFARSNILSQDSNSTWLSEGYALIYARQVNSHANSVTQCILGRGRPAAIVAIRLLSVFTQNAVHCAQCTRLCDKFHAAISATMHHMSLSMVDDAIWFVIQKGLRLPGVCACVCV